MEYPSKVSFLCYKLSCYGYITLFLQLKCLFYKFIDLHYLVPIALGKSGFDYL